MAEMTVFSGATGINNIVDPVRLKFDPDTGIGELAEAVNVVIDQTGRISRKHGKVAIELGDFHSAFCDKGDCFAIQERTTDAAIMQVGSDKKLTGVRSALAKYQRMAWAQVGPKTYYTNGAQNGIIEGGISVPWAAQEHVGAKTTRQFSGPPLGSDLAWFSGRMYIVDGKFIYYSEPFAPGKYDLARNWLAFTTDVRLIKPVETGMYISDSEATYFFSGLNPKEFERIKVLDVPAHFYSAAIDLVDASSFEMEGLGLCAIWSCDLGLCLGPANGQAQVITKQKMLYPKGTTGASIVFDDMVFNTVE